MSRARRTCTTLKKLTDRRRNGGCAYSDWLIIGRDRTRHHETASVVAVLGSTILSSCVPPPEEIAQIAIQEYSDQIDKAGTVLPRTAEDKSTVAPVITETEE